MKKFVSSVQSERIKNFERVQDAIDSGLTNSSPNEPFVPEHQIREPRIFVLENGRTRANSRYLTDEVWEDCGINTKNTLTRWTGTRCAKMNRSRRIMVSTLSLKPPPGPNPRDAHVDKEGNERSAKFRQQFEGQDGSTQFEYVGRNQERRKLFPAKDENKIK